jgi:hypothetical protein
MITFAILILIVAKALPGLNTYFSLILKYPISFYCFFFSRGTEEERIIKQSNSSNNKSSKYNGCISFIDYFLSGIVCLLFLLVTYYMFESYFIFFISFYISFLVSLYVSDNFKYSSALQYIIRLNQKFAITIIIMFLSIIVVFYIMDYSSPALHCWVASLGDNINHILCEGSDSVDVSNSNSDSSNNSSNNSPNKLSNSSPQAQLQSREGCNSHSRDGGKDNYVKKEDIIVTSKEVLEKVGEVVTTIVKDAVGPFIENIATAAGAGSAGGVIGGKIISSMPAGSSITHKVIAGAGAATITAAGVAGAIKSVNAAFSNRSTKDSISSNINTLCSADTATPPALQEKHSPAGQLLGKSNSYCKAVEERSPSPVEEFIHSVLEPSEITSPLETLLDCQIFFILLSLLCILCIIMILSMWVFNKYNINIIKYILGSRLGNKLMGKIVNIKFIKNMNNKVFISMIVIYTILLIFCLIFQIFIGVELRLNIEDYIEVHKHIKNSGISLIFISPRLLAPLLRRE